MKILFYLSLLLAPALCGAETFVLKDGARLEGEVTGEMDDTLLVNTRYGSLTIKKADIQERVAAPAAPAAPPAASTAPVALSTAAAPAPEAPQVKLTFATVLPSTSTRQLVYYENGVAIATETFDSAGALLGVEGAVKDGTYTEYYEGGALKTVKSALGGKTSGSLKAYYPAGALQVEAYYLGGLRDGLFRYYGEDGKPVMEASYRNDLLNGWKREFGPDGLPRSETYYIDDKPAEAPKPQAAPVRAAEQESLVTVKSIKLARGERFSFQLNGKYMGKAMLDKDFNLISQEGKVPDGTVKAYSAEGKLQKEFIFEKAALRGLRVYEDGGPLKAEYTYVENKAVKKP